jgi:histidine ammonia-lyase
VERFTFGLRIAYAAVVPLVLTGSDLSIDRLVAAARAAEPVALAEDALERMRANRAFAERVAERGDEVYGLTTGVGVRKRNRIDADELAAFNRRLVREHRTGLGAPLPADQVRAAAILLLNQLAAGRSNVRPETAVRIAERVSAGAVPEVRALGSTGMGDVVPLADLVAGLLADDEIAVGEALPLIGQSSVLAAQAALAVHDARVLLDGLVALAALDLEAYAANPSPLHPAVGEVRPYPGLVEASSRLRALLAGTRLWDEEPRHLQAPLAFRNAAGVLGAAIDLLGFAEALVAIELNAHQQNPLVLEAEDRMVPVADFEMAPVAAAMDVARLALAPCLAVQAERSLKLLQASGTGLTDGLEPPGDRTGHGLSEIAWPLQAIAAEARLLVQPVSAEIASSTQAEGIEDRMTMGNLGARRLAEMADLGARVAAIGAVIACQAVDLRGVDRLGPPLADLHDRVRALVPPLRPGDPPPLDLEPLVEGVAAGLLGGRG